MEASYDVIVIGGGIQGVGVAQAAAAQGYSVLLLEKSKLASGTSCKSSKLIHGGLRYLESAQFSLVRECLTERAILLKIAPQLVRMQRFIIPIYKQTRRSSWAVRVGLWLYYTLANFRRQAKPSSIKQEQWTQLDGLNTQDLKAVFSYPDAQTDDRLLTQAVMLSAQGLGAELQEESELISARVHTHGCQVNYRCNEQVLSCNARVVINAAGPWVNDVAGRIEFDSADESLPKQSIDLVAGTHIELPGEIKEGIYYTEAPRDGRAIFVMPWYGRTLVGTTERKYHGAPEALVPSHAEQRYLLNTYNHYFGGDNQRAFTEISNAWAGLRVLPSGNGHAFHRSREVIYQKDRDNKPRVLSIYGGKLTAYRATAQQVMEHIESSLPEREAIAFTDQLPLVTPG